MRNPNYTDKEKVLLYIIADHCQFSLNTGKVCELSYSLIKKWTGWGDHTVQNTIASLVEKGDITYTTERLQGNRKSTAIVNTGYCRNDSNNTVETAVQGTVVAAVNNKQEKQQRNSTIAIDTYSSKCGSDFNYSSCSVAEDTTCLDEVNVFQSGETHHTKTELEHTIDQMEWCIDNGVWASDVSFELAFDKLSKNVEGLDVNYDYLRDRFDKRQTKKSLTRLAQCVSA